MGLRDVSRSWGVEDLIAVALFSAREDFVFFLMSLLCVTGLVEV